MGGGGVQVIASIRRHYNSVGKHTRMGRYIIYIDNTYVFALLLLLEE